MIIQCENWSRNGLQDGGACGLGLYGGRPSYGVCRGCEHYKGERDDDPTKKPVNRRTRAEPLDLTKPGDLLAYTVKKIYGYTEQQAMTPGGVGCDCNKLRREMNEKGWLWCIKNRADLMKRIEASAKKRDVIINGDTLWSMLKTGWEQSKIKETV